MENVTVRVTRDGNGTGTREASRLAGSDGNSKFLGGTETSLENIENVLDTFDTSKDIHTSIQQCTRCTADRQKCGLFTETLPPSRKI